MPLIVPSYAKTLTDFFPRNHHLSYSFSLLTVANIEIFLIKCIQSFRNHNKGEIKMESLREPLSIRSVDIRSTLGVAPATLYEILKKTGIEPLW